MGFFKRLSEKIGGAARKVTGRGKAAPEAPSAAGPRDREEAGTVVPPAEEGEPSGEAPEGGSGEGREGSGGRKSYPSSLHVSINGEWVISKTRWKGVISGTLYGEAVKAFLDEMDGRDNGDHAGIRAVAFAYDVDHQGFGAGVNLEESEWETPIYSDPGDEE